MLPVPYEAAAAETDWSPEEVEGTSGKGGGVHWSPLEWGMVASGAGFASVLLHELHNNNNNIIAHTYIRGSVCLSIKHLSPDQSHHPTIRDKRHSRTTHRNPEQASKCQNMHARATLQEQPSKQTYARLWRDKTSGLQRGRGLYYVCVCVEPTVRRAESYTVYSIYCIDAN